MYAVLQLAQFNSNPKRHHWDGIEHVLMYLKGNILIEIVRTKDPSLVGERVVLTDHALLICQTPSCPVLLLILLLLSVPNYSNLSIHPSPFLPPQAPLRKVSKVCF